MQPETQIQPKKQKKIKPPKNPIIENVLIDKIGYKGVWIATLENGKKILVKWNVVPWATATVHIRKKKKGVIMAEIVQITKAPADRVDEKQIACDHYANPLWDAKEQFSETSWCGWCKRQIIPYPKQLEIKRDQIREAFVGHELSTDLISAVLPSPEMYYYRNKIEFSFWKYITRDEPRHERQAGFHKPWMFSKVLDVQQCHLISSKAHALYKKIKWLCVSSWLPVYDSKTHIWFFRHLVIREWINTEQFLVNLSVATDHLMTDSLKKIWSDWCASLTQDNDLTDSITTFCITENNWLADIIRNPEAITSPLRWDWFFHESLVFRGKEGEETKLRFRLSPFSFFQTNTYSAQVLFETAASLLPDISGTILDMYCGAWSIGMSLLAMGKWQKVVWIEIVEEAIVDAKHNARINWLEEKTEFFAGKAEQLVFREPRVKDALTDMWLIVVDPPRDWLHPSMIKFLSLVKKHHACPFLYISCNPITLARDLALLVEQWRTIQTIQAVDMFPHTYHVETIVVLK